ncbi:MAG: site-specific DNA-methyltransferase [Spirochaetales bacterium]|nr:site-specific DNA-methyltransferase [Spirochaetales bacterium]
MDSVDGANATDATDMKGVNLETAHRVFFADARDLSVIQSGCVDLVVTSPPYPMIEMWDAVFSSMAAGIRDCLESGAAQRAFDLMHGELDKVWREIGRVTKDGAFVCVTIGDAARTVGGPFQLYSNHSRVIRAFREMGFTTLPVILWRKQTNAPNKFMGSGMLPAGAYVTLEHEYILIFRKGGRRLFATEELKRRRMESAFFWEERNIWFSDVWDFKGVRQNLGRPDLRGRSGGFPFELAWRLVNMYSLYGDLVLDPFAGTGTSLHAAAAAGRNSVGFEIDRNFEDLIFGGMTLPRMEDMRREWNRLIRARAEAHARFIQDFTARRGKPKYTNAPHGFPVITRQETGLTLMLAGDLNQDRAGMLRVRYTDFENPVESRKRDREQKQGCLF